MLSLFERTKWKEEVGARHQSASERLCSCMVFSRIITYFLYNISCDICYVTKIGIISKHEVSNFLSFCSVHKTI